LFSIALDGSFCVSHRLDKAIKNALNAPGVFSGEIMRKDNIGKTAEQLIVMKEIFVTMIKRNYI
jgi:hypothetical protein